MKRSILTPLLLVFFTLSAFSQTNYMNQWPQFRGPFASGIVETTSIPDSWDIESGENIKWKVEIPGLGHSCPVIWDDKLFVTTAISGSGTDSLKVGLYGDIDDVDDLSEHEFKIFCFDKNTGKEIWSKTSYKGVPKTKRHTKSSAANPTPATNGKYVVAFFGSDGLYCYDMDGILFCYDAKTGKIIYRDRLPGNNAITASAIASNGKIYYSTEQGDVFIVKAGKNFEVLGKNSMNDIIMATPAISNNTIYWRTQHYLVAVGK